MEFKISLVFSVLFLLPKVFVPSDFVVGVAGSVPEDIVEDIKGKTFCH